MATKYSTAEELKRHPEYPTVYWDLKPTKKGTLPVAECRGGPFNISWEIHGEGPKKILVRPSREPLKPYSQPSPSASPATPSAAKLTGSTQLIMGLGGIKQMWQRQTRDFGHTNSSTYSVLIFDNRGIGRSDSPTLRYSTSSMAADSLELLQHVGWTSAPRQVHAIGISMGGMIAQELALLAPESIASLTLVSTAPRLVNTVGFVENARRRVGLLVPKGTDAHIAAARSRVMTAAHAAGPDDAEAESGTPFASAGDRLGAGEVWKRDLAIHGDAGPLVGLKGVLSQMVAAAWHHKSPEQMKKLADAVGTKRIAVVHGDADDMVTFPHANMLVEEMSRGAGEGNGVRLVVFPGQAHVIPLEKRKEFNKIVEEMVEAGERENKAAGL